MWDGKSGVMVRDCKINWKAIDLRFSHCELRSGPECSWPGLDGI